MALFSPGTGGTIGGPSVPFPREQEATATAELGKMLAGLIQDSLDRSFSQVDLNTTWKYNSTSGNPLMPMLSRLRLSMPPGYDDTAWQNIFNQLIEYLPDDVKQQLFVESRLPADQRSIYYGALDDSLGKLAKTMAWAANASSPMSEVDFLLVDQNNALPELALQGLFEQGSEILAKARSWLEEIGPNSLNFDQQMHAINSIQANLNQFKKIARSPVQDPEGYALIADKISTLNEQTNAISFGNDLQVLKPLVSTMTILSSSLALQTGSAPLLLSMSCAAIGINDADSAGGILPGSVSNAIHSLSTGMQTNMLPKADPGSRQLLPLLAMANTILGSTLTAWSNPDTPEGLFSLDLMLHFALSSGAIATTAAGIAQAAGASEATLPISTATLGIATVLPVLLTTENLNKGTGAVLIESIAPYLSQWLNQLEPFVATEKSSQAQAVNVLIQQAKIALHEKEYPIVMQAISNAYNLFVQDPGKDHAESLHDFMTILWRNVVLNEGDLKMTSGIVQG